MRCQHTERVTHTEETSGGSWQDYTVNEQCETNAREYRACGRGCNRLIAYCAKHGGDYRAIEEMRAHHVETHGMHPTAGLTPFFSTWGCGMR